MTSLPRLILAAKQIKDSRTIYLASSKPFYNYQYCCSFGVAEPSAKILHLMKNHQNSLQYATEKGPPSYLDYFAKFVSIS